MSLAIAIFLFSLALAILLFWYFATDNDATKRWVGTVLSLGATVFCLVGIMPPDKMMDVLNGKIPFSKGLSLLPGIDINGGSSFTLELQESPDQQIGPQTVEQAIGVIRERLNSTGRADLTIAPRGTKQIFLQMPGVKEEERSTIREQLQKAARLDFHLVHPESATLLPKIKAGEFVPGYKVITLRERDKKGNEIGTEEILVTGRPDLRGTFVKSAYAVNDPTKGWVTIVGFDDNGREQFATLTGAHTGERLAVVLDGEAVSAPRINEAITQGSAEISGMGTGKGATELATALQNPLEAPLVISEERSVSPTLGAEAVKQGILSGVFGLCIVMVFMVFYYKLAGLIALIGLLVNMVLLFGIMAMFQFTFTLPGIAGIILTIGMAVDSSVLIYERLKEELAAGKSIASAIAASYDKAFSAIFDANITTLITGAVLFWMATDSVRGFAVTLICGILGTLFASLLVTRVCFRWLTDTKSIQTLAVGKPMRNRNIDFLAMARKAALFSLALTVISIGACFIRGEDALGIDFKGGDMITFQMTPETVVGIPEVEKALSTLGLAKTPVVEEMTNPGSDASFLRLRVEQGAAGKVVEHIRKSFPGFQQKDASGAYVVAETSESVGPTMGASLMLSSGKALLVGLIGIFIYLALRFEFSFSLGAIIALLHDLVITIGIMVLAGREMSAVLVGSFLTVAGYSVNDTIVVFDRIRETINNNDGDLRKIMNEAINATLSRTTLTSLTTLFTLTFMAVFGGPAIQDFSLALVIGIVVGTYSSIFVASAFVFWWTKMRGKSLQQEMEEAKARETPVVIE